MPGAISADIDTLNSIYHGRGRRRAEYTYAEFRMGLENLSRFLEPYGVSATLFMVGSDLLVPQNQDAARAVAAAGHEIANHTHTHAQGFRLLTAAEQEHELAQMEDACVSVTGRRPVGFRSPGWNMGDAALPLLKRRGYLYDSSVHPMFATPALKALHWLNTGTCDARDRSTLGQWSYMFAPLRPYRTDAHRLSRRGGDGIVEFPLSVVPGVRAPFWATFLLATGLGVFTACYRAIRAAGLPIHYMFHLSDFVDYSHPDLADQVPASGGVYVPRALSVPLAAKLELFRKAMDIIAADYALTTLEQWAPAV
ncbi:MAG TPA: polysaccharide deacetylase family protein [Vicinamibacterales bacterium]|nr:polysaccharide deacetylase family protein [Vicinamibacterales bacterium]